MRAFRPQHVFLFFFFLSFKKKKKLKNKNRSVFSTLVSMLAISQDHTKEKYFFFKSREC